LNQLRRYSAWALGPELNSDLFEQIDNGRVDRLGGLDVGAFRVPSLWSLRVEDGLA
jgi:hypothetical protein